MGGGMPGKGGGGGGGGATEIPEEFRQAAAQQTQIALAEEARRNLAFQQAEAELPLVEALRTQAITEGNIARGQLAAQQNIFAAEAAARRQAQVAGLTGAQGIAGQLAGLRDPTGLELARLRNLPAFRAGVRGFETGVGGLPQALQNIDIANRMTLQRAAQAQALGGQTLANLQAAAAGRPVAGLEAIFQQQLGPQREALEAQFQQARQGVLERTGATGGALTAALGGLEAQRALGISQQAGQVAQQRAQAQLGLFGQATEAGLTVPGQVQAELLGAGQLGIGAGQLAGTLQQQAVQRDIEAGRLGLAGRQAGIQQNIATGQLALAGQQAAAQNILQQAQFEQGIAQALGAGELQMRMQIPQLAIQQANLAQQQVPLGTAMAQSLQGGLMSSFAPFPQAQAVSTGAGGPGGAAETGSLVGGLVGTGIGAYFGQPQIGAAAGSGFGGIIGGFF